MKVFFLILFVSSVSFGHMTCDEFKVVCEDLQDKYIETLEAYTATEYDIIPDEILKSESEWALCLQAQHENSCNK